MNDPFCLPFIYEDTIASYVFLQLVCVDEETERVVQVISPIHPDATQAELQNLKHGNYLIYLEVHVRLLDFCVCCF